MKTRDILLRQCLVGVFFVLGGILWLGLYYENLFGKLFSGFFIILGIFISIKSYSKWKRWKDSEIHTLFGLRLINEIIFTALMGPVFAVASVLYALLFYKYEKGVNEN